MFPGIMFGRNFNMSQPTAGNSLTTVEYSSAWMVHFISKKRVHELYGMFSSLFSMADAIIALNMPNKMPAVTSTGVNTSIPG